MASGPHFDRRRGTYYIRWYNGKIWTNSTVHRLMAWKAGSPRPKKDPPEAMAALKDYADRERDARAGRGADPKRKVAEFLADYRAGYAGRRAPASAVQLDQATRAFLAFCEADGIATMEQVTPAACQRFLDRRAGTISAKTGKSITPVRLSLERGILGAAWQRALKLGAVESNPWRATEAPGWDRARKAKVKLPSWSPEEVAKILDASAPWLQDLITLGTQTGLRIGALTRVEWTHVEWSGGDGDLGAIRVPPGLDKAGKGYAVPLSPKAHDLLMRAQSSDPHPRYLLKALRGGRIYTCVADESISAACVRAGLPVPPSPNHTMRRTFGRWAVLGHLTGSPIPVYVVSRWLGHSSVKMTMDYLDVSEADSRSWMVGGNPPSLKEHGPTSAENKSC